MSQNSDKIDPGAIILLRNKSNKKQHKRKEKKERHQKSSIKQYKKSIEKCKEFGIGIMHENISNELHSNPLSNKNVSKKYVKPYPSQIETEIDSDENEERNYLINEISM